MYLSLKKWDMNINKNPYINYFPAIAASTLAAAASTLAVAASTLAIAVSST